jgi:hypothetical protein
MSYYTQKKSEPGSGSGSGSGSGKTKTTNNYYD